MAQVYGYDEQDNDLRLFPSEADWERQLTVSGIKRYLTGHLRNQLVRELPVAIEAFKKASAETRVGTGFWGLVRMVLAPVSFLGALYRGNDSTDNAIEFLEEYVGRRQSRPAYLDLSALLFVMFRHGLIHTSMPKVVERDDGRIIGWGVTFNPADHLTKKSDTNSITLFLSPEQLYHDLVQAIDSYVRDFDGPVQAQLVAAFKRGYLTMGTINRVSGLPLSTSARLRVTRSLNTL
ncbi:MAG: hypothetical protein HYV04_10210 [Deltaproteobacteria bacterium]|nr:hypothetical protein [Deltaproteobacteria bacterium]